MKKYIIAFASVTYANKAETLFNKMGVAAKIIRTPGKVAGGCGYSIVLSADPVFIMRTLEKNGIPYKGISEEKSN